MAENFNAEYLNSNGGDFHEIAKYCSTHRCHEPFEHFPDYKEECKSYRDGRCMMLRFMKERGIT